MRQNWFNQFIRSSRKRTHCRIFLQLLGLGILWKAGSNTTFY